MYRKVKLESRLHGIKHGIFNFTIFTYMDRDKCAQNTPRYCFHLHLHSLVVNFTFWIRYLLVTEC